MLEYPDDYAMRIPFEKVSENVYLTDTASSHANLVELKAIARDNYEALKSGGDLKAVLFDGRERFPRLAGTIVEGKDYFFEVRFWDEDPRKRMKLGELKP